MRLLNATTYELEDFSNKLIPEYAILSHTWDHDEVTYQDLLYSTNRKERKGWAKIVESCRLALYETVEYVWVDTCCIDKSSSADLSEAINSMFGWYQNAYVCFAYLSDLKHGHSIEKNIGNCRWWGRGWTLQELIAPKRVEFYDAMWTSIGSRKFYSDYISRLTNIPEEMLQLGWAAGLKTYSVAARMSWAARRETTKPEDIAYCLLGIFDIQMPIIYGEGHKAFLRLQHEIMKRSNDLTIFACELHSGYSSQYQGQCLFAESPSDFIRMTGFKRFSHTLVEPSVTSRGVKFSGELMLRVHEVSQVVTPKESSCLVLYLGHFGDDDEDSWHRASGICLRKVGPKLYHRDPMFNLVHLPNKRVKYVTQIRVTDVYLLTEFNFDYNKMLVNYRKGSVHIPEHDMFDLDDAVPESLWDIESRLFLRPRPNPWQRYDMVLATLFVSNALRHPLVALCDYRESIPRAKIFQRSGSDAHIHNVIFQERCRENSMSWTDLELQVPAVRNLQSSVIVELGNTTTRVSVSCKMSTEKWPCYNVCFEVTMKDAPPRRMSRHKISGFMVGPKSPGGFLSSASSPNKDVVHEHIVCTDSPGSFAQPDHAKPYG